jgi:hypothetical protein
MVSAHCPHNVRHALTVRALKAPAAFQ